MSWRIAAFLLGFVVIIGAVMDLNIFGAAIGLFLMLCLLL